MIEDLILMPWWASLGISAVVYVGGAGISSALIHNPASKMVGTIAGQMASWVGLLLVFVALVSALRSWGNSRMLENQTGLESLRQLPWKRFEDLMAEAFRRKGYGVEEMLGGGADGGVDLVLRRAGGKTLVQCKRWRGKPVPVQVVRELYGVLMAENASAAKLVATSNFTSEAVAFAKGKPIELVDGPSLVELLQGVQTSGKITAPIVPVATTAIPDCPRCASPMKERVAKRGANAGSCFWGCSRYPACNGTQAQ